MKTIIVPTDFSDTASKALKVAKEIAGKTGATIHLAHFYMIKMADYAYPDISMPEQITEELRKASEQGMDVLVKALQEEGITVKTTVKMGLTTDSIVDLVKETGADLIVMGTTGSGSLINKLIGSNAANVMEQIEIPIILVPAECVFDGIHRIVYADSLDEDDTPVLKELFDFAETVGAPDISILNINTANHYEPVNHQVVMQLNKIFGEENIKLNLLDADNVKEGIDHYLEEHNIDLVVMSTQKKSLLDRIFSRSNTKVMALHSKVPLMVYHKQQAGASA